MPSDPLRDQKFISSLHAFKISGPCRSPFFIPAELTALLYGNQTSAIVMIAVIVNDHIA